MRFTTAVLVVVLASAALLVLAWLGQRRLMYLAGGGPVPHPRDVGLATASEVTVPTEDGLSLGAWYVEPTAPAVGWTVILFNGNAGHRAFRAPLARRLSERGIATLMLDYRGYGGNPGTPTESGLLLDARAARRWLDRRLAGNAARVAYFGESLGTGVAVALAAERQPDALILRSPYTSMVDVGAFHYPWLPVRQPAARPVSLARSHRRPLVPAADRRSGARLRGPGRTGPPTVRRGPACHAALDTLARHRSQRLRGAGRRRGDRRGRSPPGDGGTRKTAGQTMTHTLLRDVAVRLLPVAVCCAGLAGCLEKNRADLVIRGKVATVDASFSIREAVAVRGGVIVYVGDRAGADRFVGPETTVIDAGPGLVLPGLVDAHAHMYSYAQELANLDVTGTRSYSEVVARVAERVRAAGPGEWVLGGRWDQTDWADTAFPVHDALSAVSPDNPVYLKRVDGNAALANAAALKAAGITRQTANPPGGVIHRKAGGEPSGVLVNRAMDLVEAAMPKDAPEAYERKLLAAIDRAAAFGLTGWHEAGVTPPEIAIYRRLVQRGALKLRCYAMLGDERNPEYRGDLAAYFRANRVEDDAAHMFAVRSVKVFFDGALGSRGAAFYEPYADDPKNIGLLRVSPEHIEAIARAALETGMQVGTHCIGIRGNRLALEAYEKALRAHPGVDHRFRIEHAQFVEPRDVAKFAELGVLAAMQPTHATSDMGFVEARVGPERAKFGYAWRDFLNAEGRSSRPVPTSPSNRPTPCSGSSPPSPGPTSTASPTAAGSRRNG